MSALPHQAVSIVAAMMVALAVATLRGHAELLRADPGIETVVPTPPSTLRLWFSEPVDAIAGAVVVVAPDGTRVDRRDSQRASDDETALVVSVNSQATGTYLVEWRAISADSHPISGSFSYSVGERGPPPANTGSRSETPPLLAQAAVRWVHLVGLAWLCGPMALLVLLRGMPVAPAVVQALWRSAVFGGWLLLAVAVAALVVQATAVAASVADGLRPAALAALVTTRWGVLWVLRVLAAATMIRLAALAWRGASGRAPDPWLGGATLLVAGALIALTAVNGHAAATPPVWLSLVVDWLHAAAAATWLGGLAGLRFVVLPLIRRADDATGHAMLSRLVPRFSTTAATMVVVLGVTGTYQAWVYVGTSEALLGTGYGQALLVKLALVALILVPAGFHRLVVRRWTADNAGLVEEGRLRLFQGTLGIETALGIATLAVVGLLTSQPPARAAALTMPATRGAVTTLHGQSGGVHVSLSVGPGRVGSNRVEAQVLPLGGAALSDPEVRFRVVPPPDARIDAWTVVPAPSGDAVYAATVALAPPGRWTLVVSVRPTQGEARVVEFVVPIPTP